MHDPNFVKKYSVNSDVRDVLNSKVVDCCIETFNPAPMYRKQDNLSISKAAFADMNVNFCSCRVVHILSSQKYRPNKTTTVLSPRPFTFSRALSSE